MAMQNLDLEEQEQLASVKAWWKDYGGLVLGLITAAALALAAWQGWNWYLRQQALQAGALYEALLKAVQESNVKDVRDTAGALAESHPRTLYAAMGALTVARYYHDRGDAKAAKAQLQWAVERSVSGELRDLARLRLAALLLDEKAYDEALRALEAAHGAAFDAQYALLKGDVLAAKGQPAEAKAAYKLALEKSEPRNEAFRAGIELRLDALGG